MASWIRRPDPSSNVGEVDISNAAAERASAAVALGCEAGAAIGFAREVESCVAFVETLGGLVVAVAPGWVAGTSGGMAEDGAESRVAVVGAALSEAGSNPAETIMASCKPTSGDFICRVLRVEFCVSE